jgi:hypothetical protein
MIKTIGTWELFGAGLAAGGTAVWMLAAAARIGVLRAILDLFPRGSWNAVTWVLIPALLLAPIVVQGLAVAALAARPRAAWSAVAAAAAGSLVALAVFGTALLIGVRQLPRDAQAWLGRTGTEALIIAFSAAILAGWLLAAARLVRVASRRWAVLPIAAVAVAVAWITDRHLLVALSYVLDRPEANGFFSAVALGGGAGSAWAAGRAGAAQPARAEDAGPRNAGPSRGNGGRTRRRVGASHGA